MKRIFASNQHLDERRRQRSAEYWTILEAAVLEKTPDGWWLDADHPAFEAAKSARPAAVKIKQGMMGLAKAALGIDRASDELIRQRTEICRGCEHAKFVAGKLASCGLCGCIIKAKVRIPREHCPIKKW
jgi:hypothetical protein